MLSCLLLLDNSIIYQNTITYKLTMAMACIGPSIEKSMMKWQGIDEFVHVAEAMSFTQAAKKMQVSTAQVSRQVTLLEETRGQCRRLAWYHPVLSQTHKCPPNRQYTRLRQRDSISLSCDTTLNPKDEVIDSFDVILSFHREYI